MKRISIFTLVLIAVVPSLTRGYSPYYFRRHRVHWSFHAHGLVPGDLRYNPHAKGYGRTGLVPYWVRYSPYAHGINHPSGLVDDYAGWTGSIYYCPGDTDIYRGSCSVDSTRSQTVEDSLQQITDTKHKRENLLARIKTRREALRQLSQARRKEHLAHRSVGKNTIVAYLKGRNIDYRMNRLLSMEGKVLSADFILGDGKTVISYWNPVEIEALDQQAEHKLLRYQNYVDSWKSFCTEYQRAGGHIFQIVSTDKEEILARLTLCDKLSETQTTYASAQTKPGP